MALFGRNDDELAKREKEVQRIYADIKLLLQKQQNEIATKFQDLGTLDAAIMTRSNLETIYQQQLQALEEQKKSLAADIGIGAIKYADLSHDPQQMRLVYEQGREVGERYIEKIKTFYTCE